MMKDTERMRAHIRAAMKSYKQEITLAKPSIRPTPNTPSDALKLAKMLQEAADDPMWANHAETPKALLSRAATALTFMAGQVEMLAHHQVRTTAAQDVLFERSQQIKACGWTPEHDDKHSTEELAFAAACYVTAEPDEAPPEIWPWDTSWWKPKDRRSNLVKAGALILAEIERLDRPADKASRHAAAAPWLE